MKRLYAAFILTLLIPAIAIAYTLMGYPKFQAFDSNGVPLAGGKLYTYEPGSGTSKVAYQTGTGTAHSNPIVLDSRGEATIFFNGSYKLVLKDTDGSLIWTFDNFQGTGVNYDTSSSVSGYVAISAESGTSEVRFVPTISGNSLTSGTVPSSALVDPITTGVSSMGKTLTGNIFAINLTSSETLSGNSLYGTAIGNWGATAGVTATIPNAKKGMSALFTNTQGQQKANAIYVSFNAGDIVYGLDSLFTTGGSVVSISGATMTANMTIISWADNKWWATSATDFVYRNK